MAVVGLVGDARIEDQRPAAIPIVGPTFLPNVGLLFQAPNGTVLTSSVPWRMVWKGVTAEVARRPLFVAEDLLAAYREEFVSRLEQQDWTLVEESPPGQRPLRFDLRRADQTELRILFFPHDSDVDIVQISGGDAWHSALATAMTNAEEHPPVWLQGDDGLQLADLPLRFEVPDNWLALPEADPDRRSIQLMGPLSSGLPVRRITIRGSEPGAPETATVISELRTRIESDGVSSVTDVREGRFRGVPAVSYTVHTTYAHEGGALPIYRRGVLLRTADHRILSVDVALPSLEMTDERWNELVDHVELLR